MAKRLFIIAGALALASTLFSLTPTDWWLVRALDLVREPATYLFTALLVAGLFFAKSSRGLIAALFGSASLINLWCIWPYSMFAPTELELAENVPDAQCFTAYAANVKMENRDFDAMIDQIEKIDPDLLFLTETDQTWIDALQPVVSRYPYVRTHPQDDTFGKVFASRVATVDTDVIERAGEDTPTLRALLRASDRDLIAFTGLHPKAPLPGQDTDERDNSILRAADGVDGQVAGEVIMGDFNDTPWSSTTSAFREKGDWKDPRIGRGTFPTFPSWALPVGWPLDQIMIKGELMVGDFQILESNGSDHRAILTRLCLPRPINRESSGSE